MRPHLDGHGLWHKTYRERLSPRVMHTEEKATAVFSYLEGECEKTETNSSQGCTGKEWGNWNTETPPCRRKATVFTTSLGNCWNQCLKTLWNLHPRDIHNFSGHSPDQPPLIKSCFEQKLGLDDLYSTLPRYMILWFIWTSALICQVSHISCTKATDNRHVCTNAGTTTHHTGKYLLEEGVAADQLQLPVDFPEATEMGTRPPGGAGWAWNALRKSKLRGLRDAAILSFWSRGKRSEFIMQLCFNPLSFPQ